MFKKLTVLAIVFITMSIFLPAANSAEPVITDSTIIEGVNTQIFNITLDGSKIVFNTFDQGIPEGDWFFVYSLQLVLLADLDGDFSTGYYMPISLSGGGQSGIPGIDAYIYIRITSNNTNITDALFYAEYAYRNGSYAGFTYANLPDSYHFMNLQDNKTLVIDMNWTAVKEEYMNRTGESLDLSPIIYIVPYGVTTRSYVVYQVNSQDNAAASSPISLPQANIVLDGSPQDWTSVNPALTEQFSNLGRWDTGSDIGSAYLAVNNTHLFVRIDHGGPIYMATDGPDVAKWYIIIRLDTNTDGIEDLTLLLEPNYARVWNKTAGIIRYLTLGNGYDYNNENTTMLEISIRMSQAQINLTQGQPVRILAL
ncbi:MAG: hypothetical protein GXO68_03385, partial [Crenarchaeota archaeon]|nr:hypothetical protein [Thermoproteota archaeon]